MTAESAGKYARIAGALLLLSILAGGFGEAYVPAKLIASSDAALTTRNIADSATLLRLGFAAYLVEAICDTALSLLFYALLRPVHRDAALLAAFFGILATAVFAVAELFFFMSLLIVKNAAYLKAFSDDQRSALVLLVAKAYTAGGSALLLFYGIASALRGILIFRSGYLPRFIGVLMTFAGAGFIAKNLAFVLAPRYATDLLLLPMFVAGVSLTAWLLAKGVDAAKWNAASLTAANR